MPQVQRRLRLALDRPDFLAPLSADRNERQIVAQQKGALPVLAGLGQLEQPVDRLDHGLAGAEVGVQVVMPPGGGTACPQVGVDVRAAEGIDGLFGVADHK